MKFCILKCTILPPSKRRMQSQEGTEDMSEELCTLGKEQSYKYSGILHNKNIRHIEIKQYLKEYLN
jgi:hypothetical protein